ncbi:MAG TPA: hypothetical protein VM219_09055 [Phycisphaerae bacterium]|nr:hypothetical protein [Phycisphaerae bacterium]HUX02984.1 hypothetical protein [Phycisphaerae bacterium]
MAEGCSRERWNHTASLMAHLANISPFRKKGRTLQPKDFHPFQTGRRKGGLRLTKENIGILKQVFVRSKAASNRRGKKGDGK